jgi:hypothetical protein
MLIRLSRIVVILCFVMFIPGGILLSTLNISTNVIGPIFFLLFVVSGGYFMFARCPRCRKPVHYYPVDSSKQYRQNSRLSHPLINFSCIHCGLLFSGIENNGGYTKADFLGVSALPIYIRIKGILKFLGATIVVGMMSIFLFNIDKSETPIMSHFLVGIPSFLALVGIFEFLIGVQFKIFLKNILIQTGKTKIVIIVVVSAMLVSAPLFSYAVFTYLKKLGDS